jgi:tripartite-type tricarboxylate transporter receptor subunit TctC
VIVDNRGGGGTVIGAELAARATPGGYTLFLGTATTHGINSSLYRKLPYDPIREFARFIGDEIAKYAAVVRESGAKVD